MVDDKTKVSFLRFSIRFCSLLALSSVTVTNVLFS